MVDSCWWLTTRWWFPKGGGGCPTRGERLFSDFFLSLDSPVTILLSHADLEPNKLAGRARKKLFLTHSNRLKFGPGG